ncbi:hypothetical protein [Tepidibacter hydrothermalis]|uniref:Uncharacterized protein n=1 Tax=Tepidibacter hydrothermalis TaxID=3036126 RepID=A0ABY8E736_9FIRM|nr:hypothetical protein [Tepidibacter hydrothermalis]WFD08706.1 hypothetical protein P4S50_09865 [Tepidibacter hydrothermalis]
MYIANENILTNSKKDLLQENLESTNNNLNGVNCVTKEISDIIEGMTVKG